jgi:tetratricopeptide (TPR) repeat protein
MASPLLSSFKDLAGMIGKSPWMGIFAAAMMAGMCWAMPATAALIAEVQEALERGDAQNAKRLADEALREEGVGAGERGQLLLYRGQAKELLGAHDQAMRDLTAALDTHALPVSERTEALLQRGFLRDALERLDGAAADYTAVIALNDTNLAAALNNRANVYRRQNRLDEARRDYLAAIRTENGKQEYSWYGLGQIAEAQADTLAAREYYARAVTADPAYVLASERLAALGGPIDGTIARMDDIIQLRPPQPPFGFNAATQASQEAGGEIVLRPAHDVTGEEETPIILHPPKPRLHTAPSIGMNIPTRPIQQVRLILRPAFDLAGEASSRMRGELEVQLGAWRSQAEANGAWRNAKERAAGALDGLSHNIVTAELPGRGRFYRLRVTPLGQRSAFCAELLAKGLDCLPVRN